MLYCLAQLQVEHDDKDALDPFLQAARVRLGPGRLIAK